MKIRALAALLLLIAALSGCSTAGNAILQTLPYAYGRNPRVDSAKLNPNFRYLRLTIGGHVALLVLGYVDHDAHGPIDVWYSAEREVLRLQNGRLVGAVGVTTEWRHVVMPDLPSWSAVAHAGHAIRWTRIRDVMPGYRYGVRDTLSLRVIPAPQRSALRGLDPQKLTWFEERDETAPGGRFSGIVGKRASADSALPPARYAVDFQGGHGTVVYGEQCLAANLCFSWQRWPVRAKSK